MDINIASAEGYLQNVLFGVQDMTLGEALNVKDVLSKYDFFIIEQ